MAKHALDAVWPGTSCCLVPLVHRDQLAEAIYGYGGIDQPWHYTLQSQHMIPSLQGKTNKIHQYNIWKGPMTLKWNRNNKCWTFATYQYNSSNDRLTMCGWPMSWEKAFFRSARHNCKCQTSAAVNQLSFHLLYRSTTCSQSHPFIKTPCVLLTEYKALCDWQGEVLTWIHPASSLVKSQSILYPVNRIPEVLWIKEANRELFYSWQYERQNFDIQIWSFSAYSSIGAEWN